MLWQATKETHIVQAGLINFHFSLTVPKFCLRQHRYYKAMLDSNYATTSGILLKIRAKSKIYMLGSMKETRPKQDLVFTTK